MHRISVVIPTHEMKNGSKFLRHSFNMLSRQTFKDFDVVVSDNSDNDEIAEVCREFSSHITNFDLHYFKNPIKGMAQNSNSAIKAARGELIKILYLDDFLTSEDSLLDISDNFSEEDTWMVTGCIHTKDGDIVFNPHMPKYSEDIHTGNNTIGSPSVLTIRNSYPLLFDENLTWLLDCDLYKRYYDTYGPPKILEAYNVVIRQGDHQMTNILSDEVKKNEYFYLNQKF